MNGEMFAVMAGVGFDARVIRDTSPEMKHVRALGVRLGRRKNLRAKPFEAQVVVVGRSGTRAGELGSVRQRRQCVRRRQGVRMLIPTTACSRSASGVPTGSSSGGARSHAAPSVQEVALRAHDEGSIDPGEAEPARSSTSSTEAIARRRSRTASTFSRARSKSAFRWA